MVLRCLSRRPQHRSWHAYVSPFSVSTVLGVGGALARVASQEFRIVGGEDGIPLHANLDASILCSLVHRLPLHRLVLKLNGGLVLPNLLDGCAPELKELVVDARGSVVTEIDILSISIHCTKLSYLAIHGNHVAGTLTPIWRSLGSTLTRIYIGWYFSEFGYGIVDTISVPDLVKHCVNLRHVDVLTLNEEIADVLVALGSRIRVLGIEDELVSGIALWRKVCRACTNLETVHFALDRSSAQTNGVLSLIRTKLASLTLLNLSDQYNLYEMDDLDDLNHVMPVLGRFFTVLSACSVLKEVEFHVSPSVPARLLRKFFQCLKSVTTLTCIAGECDVNSNKDIIDDIASSLRNLESLTLSTDTELEGEDVNALLDLPRLKFVTLRPSFCTTSVSMEERVVELMRKFKLCAQLLQLDIDDIDIKNGHPPGNRSRLIAEAASMYGRNDFDMFIGGLQYRTS